MVLRDERLRVFASVMGGGAGGVKRRNGALSTFVKIHLDKYVAFFVTDAFLRLNGPFCRL